MWPLFADFLLVYGNDGGASSQKRSQQLYAALIHTPQKWVKMPQYVFLGQSNDVFFLSFSGKPMFCLDQFFISYLDGFLRNSITEHIFSPSTILFAVLCKKNRFITDCIRK